MRYLSLFSGIGGFECGLDQSNIEFECVSFSEVDKYAELIYIRHFPEHTNLGDVREIETEKLPRFDFLVGGFPCQAFSHAGKRRGFDDTRGTLFFEIARILEDKRPKYFLLKNVRGLLHHDKGKTFKRILEILSNLGYYVQWEVFNSKNFVPQNRERIFIKGYFGGECGGEVFSFRRADKENNGKMNLTQLNSTKGQAQMVYSVDGVSTTLKSCDGGQGGKTGLYYIPDGCIDKHFTQVNDNPYITTTRDRESCFAVTTRQPNSSFNKKQDNYVLEKEPLKIRETTKKGYKEAYPNDGVLLNRGSRKIAKGIVRNNHCGALQTSGVWGTVDNNYRIRRLTPVECERLQGFEDNWTKYGKNDELISDTQRYKTLGNAVTVPVITFIVNEMFGDEFGEES